MNQQSVNNKKSTRKRGVRRLPRALKRLFPNVTEAVDSDRHVDVVVEKRDAREGTKRDPNECAMARAIKREYQADGAIIGMSYSYIIKKNKAIRFKAPASVRTEIVSFDRGHDFEAGEYSLSPIGEHNRLGTTYYKRAKEEHDRVGKIRKVVHKRHQTTNVRVLERGSSY